MEIIVKYENDNVNRVGCRSHNPTDLITKITSIAPGDEGREMWLESVNRTFRGDGELIDYVQQIAGLGAIGMV